MLFILFLVFDPAITNIWNGIAIHISTIYTFVRSGNFDFSTQELMEGMSDAIHSINSPAIGADTIFCAGNA
jgi:hypothetical protein